MRRNSFKRGGGSGKLLFGCFLYSQLLLHTLKVFTRNLKSKCFENLFVDLHTDTLGSRAENHALNYTRGPSSFSMADSSLKETLSIFQTFLEGKGNKIRQPFRGSDFNYTRERCFQLDSLLKKTVHFAKLFSK